MTNSRRSKEIVNRSDLVERLALAVPQLSQRDVDLAVRTMLAHMTEALASGQRIELRGFGSFSVQYRAPRVGRNPKTGSPVFLAGHYVSHFKPGKALREQINGIDTSRATRQTRSSERYATHSESGQGAGDILA